MDPETPVAQKKTQFTLDNLILFWGILTTVYFTLAILGSPTVSLVLSFIGLFVPIGFWIFIVLTSSSLSNLDILRTLLGCASIGFALVYMHKYLKSMTLSKPQRVAVNLLVLFILTILFDLIVFGNPVSVVDFWGELGLLIIRF